MSYHYVAYGLNIESEWPFPELTPAPRSNDPDLVYRCASLDDEFSGQRDRPALPMEQRVLFDWQDMCRFAMHRGSEIVFDPGPNVSPAAVRLVLLGICLGITLHQRGKMVLHGSAVAVNGRALAFMGAKEAGKSTMVGALVHKGHRLIADDLVVLSPANGKHMLAPGYPSIKVWPETARILGLDVSNMPQIHDMVDKRWYMVGDRFQPETMPLSAMIILEEGNGPRFEPAVRAQALMRIVEQTYALRFLGKRGANRHYFDTSAQLVRDVPVYRLVRPREADKLQSVVACVEEFCTQFPDGLEAPRP